MPSPVTASSVTAASFTRRATLAASAAALLLGACAMPFPDKPQRPQPYDLGPPPALTEPAADAAPAPALGIARLHAAPALDGDAILYRLLYSQDGAQPRPYAQARWVMSPPDLLAQRLRQRVAATRPVVDAGRGLAAVELHVELEEFAHVFTTASDSEGVVRLRATALAPGSKARLLAQRSFEARQPAPSADAPGGVAALRAASDQVLTQLTQWVNALPTP